MEPGVYPKLSMRDYLSAPAVNASLLKSIVERCPQAAWFESWLNPAREREQNTATMDAGTIAHSILLEGDTSRVAIIDPQDHPAKTTGAIPEGWTNQSIRAARDAAYAAGKLPILKSAFGEIEAMVNSARAFIETVKEDEPAIWRAFQPDGGESEVSVIWEDDGGVLCRMRPDRIATDRKLIIDYKTGDTTAEPNTWGRSQMIRMGYYTAAAFYRRGVKRMFKTDCDYIFLVQECKPPYLCSLVGVDKTGFAIGGAKIDHGLRLWSRCNHMQMWPAYPSRVCYPEIPPWEVARWEETEALGIPYDPAMLFERRDQADANAR